MLANAAAKTGDAHAVIRVSCQSNLSSVVHGSEDEMVVSIDAEHIASLVPWVTWGLLDDVGHLF